MIEVLIALVVVAFGLLALAHFQVELVRNGSDSKRRTTAVNLAMQKIEDLRSFTRLTGTGESYTAIGNLDGGKIDPASGNLILPAGWSTMAGTKYYLGWVVTDYYYATRNAAPTTTVPTPAPAYPDFKKVRVAVIWEDEQGEKRSVALETVISPLNPLDSGLVASGTDTLYVAP